MTIKQLIETLKQYPEDAEVFVKHHYTANYTDKVCVLPGHFDEIGGTDNKNEFTAVELLPGQKVESVSIEN